MNHMLRGITDEYPQVQSRSKNKLH